MSEMARLTIHINNCKALNICTESWQQDFFSDTYTEAGWQVFSDDWQCYVGLLGDMLEREDAKLHKEFQSVN